MTTERQIIVAEIAPDGLDFAQLEPMVAAAERELVEAGVKERPDVVVADAGYWSNEHIDRLREPFVGDCYRHEQRFQRRQPR